MGYLDQVKELVKKQYLDAAKSKEEIDNAAKVSNALDEAEQAIAADTKTLTEKNAELVNAYKEVIKNATGSEGDPSKSLDSNNNPKDQSDLSFDESFDAEIAKWEKAHENSHIDINLE